MNFSVIEPLEARIAPAVLSIVAPVDSPKNEGNSAGANTAFVFKIILDAAASEDVTVLATAMSGTATSASGDFTATSQTVTIPMGMTEANFTVNVIQDKTVEPDETFSVQISNPTGTGVTIGAGQDSATATILNDEINVSIASTASLAEGDSGNTDMLFTVTLSAASSEDVLVGYSTQTGNASSSDFTPATNATLTIPAGQLTADIHIPIIGDTNGEADETFTVTLNTADLATVTPAQKTGTGTINNDDASINIADGFLLEGDTGSANMSFVVTLTTVPGTAFPVSVHYQTVAGTAGTGDFDATTGTLTFNDASPQTILVPIKGDTAAEGNETFRVTLSDVIENGLSVNAIVDGDATGTIRDNDVFLTINDVTVVEGDFGQQNAVFTVSLTSAVNGSVTVDYATALVMGGAKDSGVFQDFVSKTGTLTFAAAVGGVQATPAQTISIPIIGDLIYEAVDETFELILANAIGATILDGTGIGTIKNTGAGNAPLDPLPTLSIADKTILEANIDATLAFKAQLSAIAEQDITFDWATGSVGTNVATAGVDYVTVPTTPVTILAGSSEVTLNVTITGDAADEFDETFAVNLSNAQLTGVGALTFTDAQGQGTILNDDLTVSVASLSQTEGNSGTTATNLTVFLPVGITSAHPVTVNFTVANGTATAGSDYTVSTLTATIPAGSNSVVLPITINGDTLSEADETFSVTLTSAQGAVLGTSTATGTITNDDTGPTVSINSISISESDSAVFIVTLSELSGKAVIVKWVTEDGTAAGGDGGSNPATQGDFKEFLVEQTLTIPAGQLQGSISVPVVNDTADEQAETFNVKLTTATNATLSSTDTGTATITENDFRTISIADLNIVEGDGATIATFTVSLSSAATQTVMVNYATALLTGQATADDFVATSGTLTFTPGMTSQPIAVTINGDTTNELNELFNVILSAPQNGTLGQSVAKGTILNDETTYRLARVDNTAIGPVSLAEEGTANAQQFVDYVIIREGALTLPGSVLIQTSPDTGGAHLATAGTDFTAVNQVVSFSANSSAASQTSEVIRVAILKDSLPETDETFKLGLSQPVNGVILDGLVKTDAQSLLFTIQNNDAVPTLSIADVEVVEGNSGTKQLTFTATLSAAAGANVTFDWATGAAPGGDAATVGSDFTAVSLTQATIAAGQTTVTLSVTLTGDTTDEADESFAVNLTNALLGGTNPLTITQAQGIGTILNDDLKVTVSNAVAIAEGNAGTSNLTFSIKLDAIPTHDVTVHYRTIDGTATSSVGFPDFTGFADATVVFHSGEQTKDVTVAVNGDSFSEAKESLKLKLTSVEGAALGTTTQATGEILNDDPGLSLAIDTPTVVEGDSGTTSLVFTVTLSGQVEVRDTITVDYKTVDGTARAGGVLPDYLASSGTLTFLPNETSKTITVNVVGDTWSEITETFTVQLSNATGAVIAGANGTGTIQDGGDTVIGLAVKDARVVEGSSGTTSANFQFEFSKSVAGNSFTIGLKTRPGSATDQSSAKNGADYTAVNQTVTVDASDLINDSTAFSLDISVAGDTFFEPTETFFLDVSSLSVTGGANVTLTQAAGGVSTAQGVILNDDFNIISSRQFEYVDEDGDLVNVKFSKGSINPNDPRDVVFSSISNTTGGRTLQSLLLNDIEDGNQFDRTNITIIATPQILGNGQTMGDGLVKVGSIEAAVPSADYFQFLRGISLGTVKIDGDLGRIIAGSTIAPRGIARLEVVTLGGFPNPASSPSDPTNDVSLVLGPIGSMFVSGDVLGSLTLYGGQFGKIGSLTVKGSLKGGATDNSGRIFFTGSIKHAVIGGVSGGATSFSGGLYGSSDFNTSIGSLVVHGDITGGTQTSSGNIIATTIGSLVVDGSIEGGTGTNSGRVVASLALGKTRISGNITGGAGSGSGQVATNVMLSSVAIQGSIEGGTGSESGVLRTFSGTFVPNLPSLTIGKASQPAGDHGILAGTGTNSGRVEILGNLGKLVIYGDINGQIQDSAANGSGGVDVTGKIGKTEIHGSIKGGSSKAADDSKGLAATSVLGTGYLFAGNLGTVVIDGDIVGGENLGSGLINSGTIHSASAIASLIVNGSVSGDPTRAVIISAQNEIKSLTVNGNVSFAEILAGYSKASSIAQPRGSANNSDAQIGKVQIGGLMTASNIVAGVDAGADKVFGTSDDSLALDIFDQPKIFAKIASVIVNALGAAPNPLTDSFAITAEHVVSASVGNVPQSLLTGPGNDTSGIELGATTKTRIIEV